jgi:rod shape-determining protein MreC
VGYAGKNSTRISDSALSTLPLLLYATLSIALMVADHRSGYGRIAREQLALVTTPVWYVASSPVRLWNGGREELALRSHLQADNAAKTRALEIARARIQRLDAVAAENLRLRALLGGTRGYRLDVRLVGILDVDLDPFRQRLVLDGGSDEGVRVGQALIDSGGVLGQVIEVNRHRAIALLVTDPDHAVPVQVRRSGLRAVAYGTGSSDVLRLPNIPLSGDVRAGDVLVTSGIGGRFPAGFPVGVVTRVQADQMRLFVIGEARPAAHMERGNEALLIANLPPDTDMGPPAPAGADAINRAATEALAAATLAAEAGDAPAASATAAKATDATSTAPTEKAGAAKSATSKAATSKAATSNAATSNAATSKAAGTPPPAASQSVPGAPRVPAASPAQAPSKPTEAPTETPAEPQP